MSLRSQYNDTASRCMEIADEIEAIGQVATTENRPLSDADNKLIESLSNEFDTAKANKDSIEKAMKTQEKIAAARITEETLQSKPSPFDANASLPARLRLSKSKVYENTADAYACGKWLQGVVGNVSARNWCKDRGMSFQNAMEGGTDTLGGFAVPDPMAATIIRLVEQYGVFRRFSRNIVMSSDTLAVPRRAAGTTVYWPDEGAAITASDLTLAQVNLVAKKAAQLTIMSTELSEDAIISMTDLITTEMAWNFALAEDTEGFLGDGTVMTGIASALLAGSQVEKTGTGWSGVLLQDLHDMVGLVPQYGGQNRWYINSYGYHTFIVPLLVALGGTDMRQFEGGPEMMLLGYPVTFTQVLPGASAGASDLLAVFGDLAMGSYFGSRRNVNIRTLNELYAANDQIGIVSTERFDIQIFDTGTADDAGSIVGLFAAAT